MARIDVRGVDELQDVITLMTNMDRTVAKYIRQYSQLVIAPEWKKQIDKRASTRLENRVISATSTVAVSNQNVRVQSAAKGRRLSGGLNPKTDYAPVEFGTQGRKTTYTRRGHQVTRNTRAQFRPFNPKGYVFYPTARDMIPRLAAMWVQTIVKATADAFKGQS